MTCTSLVKTRQAACILQARFPSLLRNLMAVLPCICGISQQHFARRAHIPLSVRSCNSQKPCKNLAGANRRKARRAKPLVRNGGWLSDRREDLAGCYGVASEGAWRALCACRNKLPTCQIIGSFHQIEEPNKEGKRARPMTHPADLVIRFGAKRERPAKRAQALSA